MTIHSIFWLGILSPKVRLNPTNPAPQEGRNSLKQRPRLAWVFLAPRHVLAFALSLLPKERIENYRPLSTLSLILTRRTLAALAKVARPPQARPAAVVGVVAVADVLAVSETRRQLSGIRIANFAMELKFPT